MHDWRRCKCGAMFVDGGTEYLRRGAADLNQIEELSTYVGDPPRILTP